MNAIKFTPKNGRVGIHLRQAGALAEIVVSDTGQGIAPATLPHVFDRFWQADSSTTRKHGGLGLGLALVKHLAELHGGEVAALSEGEGSGATFTVRLPVGVTEEPAGPPARPPAVAAAVATPSAAVRLDGVRVLVADDEPDAARLAEAILSEAGAEVRSCSAAAEALDLFHRWRPDVPLDRRRALAAGYSMHVPKPVDPGELTAIVASVVGRG